MSTVLFNQAQNKSGMHIYAESSGSTSKEARTITLRSSRESKKFNPFRGVEKI
jgi:hypothetical protein